MYRCRSAPTRKSIVSRFLLFFLVVLPLAGCGRGHGPPPGAPGIDLLSTAFDSRGPAEDPIAVNFLATGALEALASGGWTSRGDGQGRWVANVSADPRLERIARLEVEVEAPASGEFVLRVEFADRQGVELAAATAGPAPAVISFPWGPELRGRGAEIRALSLSPPLGLPGRVAARDARLIPAPAIAWTGRVADRTRRSLALAAGASIEWQVSLTAHPRWTFGAAIRESGWAGGDGSHLRAEVVPRSGPPVVLWQLDLHPQAYPEHRRWFDVDLDLSEHAGRSVTLRLVADPGPAPGPGFSRQPTTLGDAPAFSSPRIQESGDTRPNVVLIVIDTLRRDALGSLGNPRADVSPHLDRLGARGVVFERAHSTAPWTVPSTSSVLTGLLPPHHGKGIAREQDTAFLPGVRLLAEHFRAAGYATAMASNNPLIEPRAGVARGVDSYDHRGLDDPQIFGGDRVSAAAVEWLDHHRSPFFLYLHYFDPHYRYQAPPPYTRRYVDARLAATEGELPSAAQGNAVALRDRLLGQIRGANPALSADELEWLRALYDAEVHYVDRCIQRVLDHLRDQEQLENTIVVVTGDHGEEFLEHKFLAHGHTLFEELLAVPLIVAGPGIVPRREDQPVSLVDVAPTLVGLAGLADFLQPSTRGRDLSAWLRGGSTPPPLPLFAAGAGAGRGTGRPEHGPKRAVWEWPRKVIQDLGGPALRYDLEQDPAERNATRVGRGADRRFLTVLDSVLAPPANWREGLREMTPELLQQLKAMGYVE